MDRTLAAGAALVCVLAVACWTDVTTRRIPNWVSLSGMALGVGLHAVQGLGALAGSLLGVAAAFLLALPFFATGALGAGDAKLLMAVGAFFGPVEFVWAALAVAVAGGVLALAEATRRRRLGAVLSSCGRTMLGWVTFGPRFATALMHPEPLAVPYGLAIAAGSLFWWFLGPSVV